MTLTTTDPDPTESCHACEERSGLVVVADPEREGWNPVSRLALCEAHREELEDLLRRRRMT